MGEKHASEEEKSRGTLRKKLAAIISGSATGAVVSLSLQPLDVLRTQLQAQAVRRTATVPPSTVAIASDIWQKGGLRSFWRGSGPTVWRLSIGLGVQFFTLETVKDALLNAKVARLEAKREARDKGELSSLEAFCTGGFARGIAAASTVPFTLAKTRMEYSGPDEHLYKGTLSALQGIVRAEGVRGIFRGAGPTILTNAPFSALYYMFYSGLRVRLQKEDRPSPAVNFVSGAIGAVAATLITQPADMIRTQMQLGLARGQPPAGVIATFKSIVATGGPSALLAGVAPRVLKRTLQTALVWTLYEELQPRLTKAVGRLQKPQT